MHMLSTDSARLCTDRRQRDAMGHRRAWYAQASTEHNIFSLPHRGSGSAPSNPSITASPGTENRHKAASNTRHHSLSTHIRHESHVQALLTQQQKAHQHQCDFDPKHIKSVSSSTAPHHTTPHPHALSACCVTLTQIPTPCAVTRLLQPVVITLFPHISGTSHKRSRC